MPTTPGFAESLASGVVDIYAAVENQILQAMADRVREGLDTMMLQGQLAEIQAFRLQAQGILTAAVSPIQHEVGQVITQAVNYGNEEAKNEIAKQLKVPKTTLAPARNVLALVQQALHGVQAAHFQILPRVTDVYTQVIRSVMNAPLLGVETRKVAAQKALDEFARRGITVFSRGGRQWQISSYVEMSLRTSLMNATLQGHSDQLRANGLDLVVVSNHAQECKLCRPYEGAILCLTGSPGTQEINGHEVHVETTMAVARANGLFHPNCRHTYSAYQPGITRDFGETADPQGDQDRQKLRYLERQVRAYKRLEAAALDDDAARDARARVREWQAAIREHVASTSARRQPDRERITGAFA